MSSIAERLTQARMKSGRSVLEAADLSGVPASEIYDFETGKAEPHDLDVRRLSVTYGCPLDSLLGPRPDTEAGG